MRLIRAVAVVVVGVGVAVAGGGGGGQGAKFDPEKLLGKYVDIEGVKAGEKADPARLKGQFVTVTKDVFKIEGEQPEQTFVFAYKVNPAKNPVEIDFEIQFPEDLKGNKVSGIVAFDGKTLKLCYHATDEKDRPKQFESTEKNGYFLWTMKKADKK